MSSESKATKDEIQRNRDEAYQNGWNDGYAEGYGKATEDAIAALPAVTPAVQSDVRDWPFYPIPMPFTADGKGPATVGVDAVEIAYEVWDKEFNSYASFDNLPDAINEAIRLSIAALTPNSVDDSQAADSVVKECLITDPAAIREDSPNRAYRVGYAAGRAAALREAAAYVSQNSLQWRFSSPWHGKDFAKEILALLTEKPHDR